LLIGIRGSVASRLLSFTPIRAIGLVSYSWYLWHWPLLSFARIACRQGIHVGTASLLVLASLSIAAATFKFLEQPLRRSPTDSDFQSGTSIKG